MSVNRNGCTQIFCWLLGPGLAPPCAGLRSQWDNKWIFWLRNLFHTSALVRSSVVSSVHRTAHSRSWLLIPYSRVSQFLHGCNKLSALILLNLETAELVLFSRFGDGDGSVRVSVSPSARSQQKANAQMLGWHIFNKAVFTLTHKNLFLIWQNTNGFVKSH